MTDPSALSQTVASLAVHDALKRGVSGAQIAQALQALQPEAPAEAWRLGDVVRDADDPEDSRAWFHGDPVDARPWMGLFGGHAWWHRHSLPTNLALIVRNGHVVLPLPSDEDMDAIATDAGIDPLNWLDLKRIVFLADDRRGVRNR